MCLLLPEVTQTQQTPEDLRVAGAGRPPPTPNQRPPSSGSEVTLTPKHKEEHQHDGVEEPQDEAEDVLVHNRRHQEHSQHGCPTGPPAQKLVGKKENERISCGTVSLSPRSGEGVGLNGEKVVFGVRESTLLLLKGIVLIY